MQAVCYSSVNPLKLRKFYPNPTVATSNSIKFRVHNSSAFSLPLLILAVLQPPWSRSTRGRREQKTERRSYRERKRECCCCFLVRTCVDKFIYLCIFATGRQLERERERDQCITAREPTIQVRACMLAGGRKWILQLRLYWRRTRKVCSIFLSQCEENTVTHFKRNDLGCYTILFH